MSLLNDCKEIARIAEENATLKIKYNEIKKVIENNSRFVRAVNLNSDLVTVYNYENIGKEVVEIMEK